MKKLSGGIVIAAVTALLAGSGLGVLAVRVSADSGKTAAYHASIASAREKASKGIYYYAKRDYLSAFAIYNGDRELFQEFLEFLAEAEDSSYVSYLRQYMKYYPQEPEPYEILCGIYYEDADYREVRTVLRQAEAAGASSDLLAEYEDQIMYEFSNLSVSGSDISGFLGEQAIVEKNGKKGLYYYGAGMVIPQEYDELTFYANGAAAVEKDGECFFVDLYGNKSGVTDRPVESLSVLSGGLCAVSVGGRYGFMDNGLAVPDTLPYEYASAYSSGVAAVKTEGRWGLIDSQGAYLVEPQYEEILLTEFGTCVSGGVIFARQQEGYVMLDAEGKRISELVFEEVCPFGLSGQPAAVKLDGQWTFVKNSGELFETETKPAAAKSFDNFLAPVSLDGETWGYMDGYGEVVIEPQFDDCRQFSPYGIAPVKRGESWGLIQLLRYQD